MHEFWKAVLWRGEKDLRCGRECSRMFGWDSSSDRRTIHHNSPHFHYHYNHNHHAKTSGWQLRWPWHLFSSSPRFIKFQRLTLTSAWHTHGFIFLIFFLAQGIAVCTWFVQISSFFRTYSNAQKAHCLTLQFDSAMLSPKSSARRNAHPPALLICRMKVIMAFAAFDQY